MLNKLHSSKSNVTYNVEKVKLNKAPRHFFLEDITIKKMTIDGQKLDVRMRADRTQYVLFSRTEKDTKGVEFTQNYYVRDHSFFNEDKVEKVVKQPKVVEQPKVEETKN